RRRAREALRNNMVTRLGPDTRMSRATANRSVALFAMLALVVVACSKREAQAPKPNSQAPASAPEPQVEGPSAESSASSGVDDEWPSAVSAGSSQGKKGEAEAQKKAAPASPQRAREEGQRERREEERGSASAGRPSAAAKDKTNTSSE